jgi:ribosome-associated heat shock protein Hsp15
MPRGSLPSPARVVDASAAPSQRLDHWLWCARFFKTRTLAAEQIDLGRVTVNEQPAKAAKLLRPGDDVAIKRQGDPVRQVVTVLALARTRGPAPQAQALYAETAASREARERAAEARRLAPEPADTIRDGRPTKRDRREIGQQAERWQRWSASLEDE